MNDFNQHGLLIWGQLTDGVECVFKGCSHGNQRVIRSVAQFYGVRPMPCYPQILGAFVGLGQSTKHFASSSELGCVHVSDPTSPMNALHIMETGLAQAGGVF